MNKKYFTKNTNSLFTLFYCLLFSIGLVLPLKGQNVIADGTKVNAQGFVQGFNVSTITAPDFSVPVGNDKLLVVVVNWHSNPGGATFVTNITYNGQTLSQAISGTETDGTDNVYSAIWYLHLGSGCTNASGSDDDIVVNLNSNATALFVSATTFQNVDSVFPLADLKTNLSTGAVNSNVTLSTSSGNMVVDGIAAMTSVDGDGTNQTILFETTGTGAGASYRQTTGASTPMNWDTPPSSPATAHVGVEFRKCATCTTFSGAPVAMATSSLITCSNTTSTLNGSGSSTGANITYEWTKLGGTGNFIGATNNITAQVDGPGDFRLKVIDTMFGCEDTQDVTVDSNTDQVVSDDNGVFKRDFDGDLTTTLSNFNVPEGCDRLLAVSINWFSVPSNNGANMVMSAKYGSDDLIELITGANVISGVNLYSSIWYLPIGSGCAYSDPSGTNSDIVVTFNNSETSAVYIGASTFQNVDQTSPFSNINTNSNSSPVISTNISGGSNNIIIDAIAAGTSVTVNASQTYIYVDPGSGLSSSYKNGNGGIVSMDWTQMSAAPYTHVVAEIVNCSSCSTFPTPPTVAASASTINCTNATSTLDGTGSSTGTNIAYEWTKVSGVGNLVGATNGIMASADGDGVFRLKVTNTDTYCFEEMDVTVGSDFTTPVAMTAASTLTCPTLLSTLEGAGSTTMGVTYQWTKVSGMGNLVGATNGMTTSADGAGVFRLTVTNTTTGCTASSDVTVIEDIDVPLAVTSATMLGCMAQIATLDGTGSSVGANYSYEWTKLSGSGNFVGATNGITATVDGTGEFRLTVTNTTSSCQRTSDITVESTTDEVVSDDNGVFVFDVDENVTGTIPNFVIPEGCDRLLVVEVNWVAIPTAGGAEMVTSVTYNGQNFTEAVTHSQVFSFTKLFSSIWYLPVGSGCALSGTAANDIDITLNNSSTSVLYVSASTFQNVDQTTPIGNVGMNAGMGIASSISIASANSNNMLIDAIMAGSTVTPDPSQTAIISTSGGGVGASYEMGTGGNVMMDWTQVSMLPFAHVAAELNNCASCTAFPAPPVIAASASIIDCNNPTATLDGTGSSVGANYTYTWTKVSGVGNLVGATNAIMASADGDGVFKLTVTDTNTNCSEEMDVTVTSDLTPPTATISASTITCTNPTSMLDGTGSSTGAVSYLWIKVSGAGNFVGATNGITAEVDGTGVFKLNVTNDGNGCLSSDIVTVVDDLAAPTATATASTITCAITNSTLDGTGSSTGVNFTYLWTKVSGAGNLIGGTNAITATVDGPGIFKLTVTNSTNGCTSSFDVTVNQDASLPIAMASSSLIDCNNASSVLDGTGSSIGANFTYSWTKISGAGNFVGGTSNITAAVDGTGDFQITVTNTDNGCTDVAMVTVTEDLTAPTVVVNASIINCANASATLDGTGSSTGVNYTYSWTKISGTGNLTGATNSIMATVDGTGVFNLLVTNTTNGCVANMDVTVSDNFDTPTATTAASTITCATPNSTLDGTGSSTTGVTYLWTKVSGSGNLVGATNAITAMADGSGTFKLTVTNTVSSCTAESTVTVSADASVPNAVTTATMITCMEENATLDGTGSSTGGDFGYTWTKVSGSGNLVGATDALMATVNGTGIFRLTVQDTILGCQSSSDVTVFSTKDQVVSDDNGEFVLKIMGETTATISNFNMPAGCDRVLVVEVNWISTPASPGFPTGSDMVTGVTYNGQNFTEATSDLTSFSFTNLYSSIWYLPMGSGCSISGAGDIEVTLNNDATSILYVSASSFQNVDQTAPIGNIASNPGSGMASTLSIMSADGNMVVDAIMSGASVTTDPTQTAIFTSLGAGAGASYEASSGGMLLMDWKQVSSTPFIHVAAELNNCATCTFFPAPPTADATSTLITCANPTSTLDGTGSSANVSYAWTKVSGTGNLTGATDASTATVDGTGIFKLAVTDLTTNCSAEMNVTVTEDLSAPTATATSTLITCANPTSTLDGAGSTTTGVTYAWKKVSGAGNLVGATDGITASTDGEGVFTLTVTKTDNGCTASFDVTVTADSGVPTSAGTASVIDCNNGTATLDGTGSSTGMNFTYSWTKVSGLGDLTGATNALMATVDSTGIFRLTVTNTDNGCTSTTDVTVTEDKTAPTVVTAASEVNCNNSNSTLDGAGSSTGTNFIYAWTKVSGAGAFTSATDGVTATVDGTGTFTLTITNTDNGCSASSNVDVIATLPPDISVSTQTDVGCYGDSTGVATVSTLNGKAPLNYAWSSGGTTATESGLPVGMYQVTVTDADGCTDDISVTITQPDSLELNATSTFISTIGGNDGTATVTPAGGTSPFGYVWSNDSTTQVINDLIAGYYTVTVTDANNCLDTVGVLVYEGLLVEIEADTVPFCEGDDLALTAFTNRSVTYKWNTGSTVDNTLANSTGIYAVTVTDGFGNTAATSLFVETLPLPDITITPDGPNQFCEGGSVNLTASGGVSFIWDDSNNTADSTLTVFSTDGYTVTVTDSNGCTNSETFSVIAFPAPNVSIESATGFDFCEGDNVTLDAVSTDIVDFFWSTLDTNLLAITLDATTDVTLIAQDGNGCVDSASVTVTERPLPVAVIAPGNLIEFCKNSVDSVDLQASGGVSYQWSNGEATDIIKVFGQNDYTVTVTDMFGCTDTETTSIVINSLPTAGLVALSDTTFCDGGSVELAASGGLTYNWSSGETTSNINATSTATYTVTVTDGNGCTDTASQNVETIPFPDVVLSPIDTSFCEGGVAILTVTTDPNTTLNWNTGESTTSIQVNTSGLYSVVVTGSNDCSTSASTNVVVNPLPIVSVSPTDTLIQAGEVVTLQATGGIDFDWSNGANSSSINTNTSGVYAVTVTDANGCTGQATSTVMVENAPIVAIEVVGDAEICEGETVMLNTIAAGIPDLTYEWNTGETTSSIVVGTTGTYTVTVTDGNGFTASTSEDITVFALPMAPQILPSNDQVLCEGESVTLTSNLPGVTTWLPDEILANSIDVNTTGTYSAYTIDANGCRSLDSAPVNVEVIPLPDAPIISYSPDTVVCAPQTVTLTSNYTTGNIWSNNSMNQTVVVSLGSPTYTVTYTDPNGCTSETSEPVSVNILLQPTASITIVGDTTICQDETVELIGNGGVSYAWNVPGPASQSITVSSSGNYIVTVTGGNGCKDTVSQNIVVNPLPMPEITEVGDTLYSDPADSYQWFYNGMILEDSTNQWIVPSPDMPGDYYVEVMDANGCFGESFEVTGIVELSDIATIEVFPIPAKNRLFVNLELRKHVPEIQLKMYNLIGQEVYTEIVKPQSSYLNHEIDLDNLPSGNYYLQLEMEGEQVVQKIIKQ